jgi:hypothetical protein
MLLRASGESQGLAYDLRAISKQGFASGVEHGDLLIEFADAVMNADGERLDAARSAVLDQMGSKALVECAAVAANFNQMVRIADATGIPIDSMAIGLTAATRETLDINHFKSARNTLGDPGLDAG